MARVFERFIDVLCQASGYDYDFLVEKFNEASEDDDVEQFIGITLERDW